MSQGQTIADDHHYVVISADTHAGASIQAYRDYLDPKYVPLFDEWRGDYKNPQKKHIGSKKHKNWDDAERMGDMAGDGVVGEIVFPNTVPPFFKTSVLICGNPRPEDYELRLAGIRAHNRWLAEWCQEYPEQRAGIGLVYLNDIDEAIEDVQWIAKNNLRGGILLPHVPDDCTAFIHPLYSREYDRFWEVVQDCDLVVNHHGGTGSPDYGREPISLPIRLAETGWFSTRSYGHLLLSGVFARYPKLRYIITEAGCAWVPERLKELDKYWEMISRGAVGEFQFPEGVMPPEPPSHYARTNCWYGASSPSAQELEGRDVIGSDRLLWGSDYPHYEGTFPHTRLSYRNSFSHIDRETTKAILGTNAADLYGFDLDKMQVLADKVGPTPAEIERPLEDHEFPEFTHSNALRKPAAAG